MKITIDVKPGTVKRLLALAGGLALVAGVVTIARAVPVTFSDGNVLTAAQLNMNFTDLEGRLAALEADKITFQSGVVVGSAFTDTQWTLEEGVGDRSALYHVDFPTAFATTPTVIVSLNYVDASNATNLRLGLAAANVTTTGFDLTFGSYSDSITIAAGASWYAFTQ